MESDKTVEFFTSILPAVTTVSLTLKEQPTESAIYNQSYTYEIALNDALGTYPSYYDRDSERYPGSPDYTNENTVFLWESGCRVNGTWDCTLACTNSRIGHNMVWNSSDAMFTLHNCLLYPVILHATAHRFLVEEPPGLLDKFNNFPDRTNSHNKLLLDHNYNGAVLAVINDCLRAVCDLVSNDRESYSCAIDVDRRTYFTVGPPDQSYFPTIVSSCC